MPAAVRAAFCDLKLIKTRQCVQLVFELPLADFDAAYEVLGGLPDPSAERWFAIAALKQPKQEAPGNAADRTCEPTASPRLPNPAKRSWRDLSPAVQAGIRCDEITFSRFLQEERPDDWHESDSSPADCVRLICCVGSRAELATNHKARVIWNQLNEQYETWLIKDRVGA